MAKVPNHAHCVQCGRAISAGDRFCSAECRQTVEEAQAKRKRTMYLTWGIFLVGVVLLVAGQLMGG